MWHEGQDWSDESWYEKQRWSEELMNAKKYGEWKVNHMCECGTSNWKCIRICIEVIVSKAYIIRTKHYCVNLRIQCNKCRRVFYITGERGNDLELQLFMGFYGNVSSVLREKSIDKSYSDVYKNFESFRKRCPGSDGKDLAFDLFNALIK